MVFNPISKIQKEPVTPVKYECHAGSPPAPAGIPPVGIQILPKRQASQRYGRPRCVHSSRWPSPAVDPDSPSPPTHQHVQASKRHEGSATGSIHSTPSSQSPPPPPNLKPPRRTRREGVRRWSRFETAVWATAPPPSTPSSLAAPRGGCTHLGARSGAGLDAAPASADGGAPWSRRPRRDRGRGEVRSHPAAFPFISLLVG
jgi:hypothetical protein